MSGPRPGQDVYLTIGAHGSIDARVVNVKDDLYVLEVPASARASAPSLASQEASVEFTNPRGVCRLDGHIPANGFVGDELRFEGSGELQLMQRRDFVRFDAIVPVTYEPCDEPGSLRDGHTLNVSGAGFLLAPPHDVEVGESMRFWLELDRGEPPIGLVGLAVRRMESGAIGIRFEEISTRNRERVVRWVFASERRSRQVTRGAT